MESKAFHKNVFLLTQVIPPCKEFEKYFKEGMFDKPNTMGFIHVSHYLFTIYDEEKFKKAVEWPIFDKRDEGKYRNGVRDFMNTIASENLDFEFPIIQPSHLHTASGTRFINLMWKFSTIVLRTYLKKQGKVVFTAPKSSDDNTLAKNVFTNLITEKKKDMLTLHNKVIETEKRAELQAQQFMESISDSQTKWFEMKQKLEDTISNAAVHPDVKKRLLDLNDKEIIQLWKDNIQKGLRYAQKQQELLRKFKKKSENVAAIVNSVVTSDSNCLDGSDLRKIDTEKFMESGILEPEAQVAAHHLYEATSLNLCNLLLILKSILRNFREDLNRDPLPDFTECNAQIEASTQDVKQMHEILGLLPSKLADLTSKMREHSIPPKKPNIPIEMDPEVLNAIVLRSSPTIDLNAMTQAEVYDAAERLELTPVENVHKALFRRYKNNDTPTIPRPLKPVSKILVSRINFDDQSFSSTINEKSPARLPVKLSNQLSTGKTSKFAHLFTTRTRKILNTSSSIVASGAYQMSDLKSHFGSQRLFNLSRDLTIDSTQKGIEVDKPAFNSTEIAHDLSTITENQEIKISVGASPGVGKVVREKRRVSIGDLVEKFKKLREQSANFTYLEHCGEDDSEPGTMLEAGQNG